ncbi:MAG: VCBS repeat-containing protein [Candidatus Acidiferrales bacterium]|jgi:hypothetical protein
MMQANQIIHRTFLRVPYAWLCTFRELKFNLLTGSMNCKLTANESDFERLPAKIVLCNLFLCLPLLLLFGLAGASRGEVLDIQQSGPGTSVGLSPQFAIADFDGDVRPDLARIQSGPNGAGTTDYWIQLQLSNVGQQSIQLSAPTGGLRIEARDVNGDHSVDLVLATAWFRQPVAILLNNGHGVFSQVEPGTFPGAFSESGADWGARSNQAIDIPGVPPQLQSSACLEANGSLLSRSPTGAISHSNPAFLLRSFAISYAGRAPPSEVPHHHTSPFSAQ